jgi:hypothetical protein
MTEGIVKFLVIVVNIDSVKLFLNQSKTNRTNKKAQIISEICEQ